MGKEAFKNFVKKNPDLASYVINNKMTWQQFYELYDLYGEDDKIWNTFKNNDNDIISKTSLKDLIALFKGIDLKNVEKTINSINKVIDVFKTFNTNEHNNYEERPKDKYFED